MITTTIHLFIKNIYFRNQEITPGKSFFPFNHDDVVAKFGFDWWICVYWTGHR